MLDREPLTELSEQNKHLAEVDRTLSGNTEAPPGFAGMETGRTSLGWS